jgi:hypothetical protein
MTSINHPNPNNCEMQVIEALAETVCLLVGCLAYDQHDSAETWLEQLETHACDYVLDEHKRSAKNAEKAIEERNLALRGMAVRAVFNRARDELAVYDKAMAIF